MADIDMRVTEAMHRIEELYYETDGHCYVSFSGGKDSTVLLALIKMCEEIYTIPENAIKAVFCNTGVEMGVTIDFVKWVKDNYYPNLEVIRPEKSFAEVIQVYGKPMKSKLRAHDLHQWHYGQRTDKLLLLLQGQYGVQKISAKHVIADKDMHMVHDEFPIKMSEKCCDWLKKKPFHKYSKENGIKGSMQGTRIDEGGVRDTAYLSRISSGGKPCTWVKDGVIQKAPIIDWTNEDIEEFIQRYNVPVSKAYTEYGFTRTGCMACPFARDVESNLKYLYDYEPNRYKAAMHWLKDVYIAQNVVLPFDKAYEAEREKTWRELYEPMRQEMLRKYRPNSRLIKDGEQLSLFD